jgi:[ribosomal protein S5]-alanine N-acetyltransferase
MKVLLETERLFLRYLTDDDADNLFELDSDPVVTRWGNGGRLPNYEIIKNETLPKWMSYYEQYENFGLYPVVEKASNQFLGWLHFFPATESKFAVDLNIVTSDEIALGYRLKEAGRGKGYATEASKALISKGFSDWDVKRVVSWTLLDNKASINVMVKAGLKFDKEFAFTANQLPNLTDSERRAVKYYLNNILE